MPPSRSTRASATEDARASRRLRAALLDWYAEHARDLPWRRTRDPYAIWVSEIMLQQTRVEVVAERWGPFLERFPDAATLGAAQEAELLEAWSGLGYYRRVRSLAAAARIVGELHGGRFPMTRTEALALPGVGRYTAGAVLSIAGDLAEPLVDGNVARVLSRLFALEQPLQSGASERALWELADALLPRRRRSRARGPGAWNQALMELGATLCTPRSPRCEACPVAAECRARASGRQAELPRPAPRRATLEVALEVLLVRDGGRVLLEERPPGGRMAGLLECPTREVPARAGDLSGLYPADWTAPGPGLAFRAGRELGRLTHGITHHRIGVRLREGRIVGRGAPGAAFTWVPVGRLAEARLAGLARKIARRFT